MKTLRNPNRKHSPSKFNWLWFMQYFLIACISANSYGAFYFTFPFCRTKADSSLNQVLFLQKSMKIGYLCGKDSDQAKNLSYVKIDTQRIERMSKIYQRIQFEVFNNWILSIDKKARSENIYDLIRYSNDTIYVSQMVYSNPQFRGGFEHFTGKYRDVPWLVFNIKDTIERKCDLICLGGEYNVKLIKSISDASANDCIYTYGFNKVESKSNAFRFIELTVSKKSGILSFVYYDGRGIVNCIRE